MAQAYLEDYVLQPYRTLTTARARVEHLRGFFGGYGIEELLLRLSWPHEWRLHVDEQQHGV